MRILEFFVIFGIMLLIFPTMYAICMLVQGVVYWLTGFNIDSYLQRKTEEITRDNMKF